MKKEHLIISLALAISLFIYVFYRTEHTVVNKIIISFFSNDKFIELQGLIRKWLPLNEFTVYSLPEGLWVFCITLTSRHYYLKIRNIIINLFYLPLIFAVGLELLQLSHFTRGRFDIWDVFASVLFWLCAIIGFSRRLELQNIFKPLNTQSMVCLFSYVIVYLAHVWQ